MKQLLLLALCVLSLLSCRKGDNVPPPITPETIAGRWLVASYSTKLWIGGELVRDDHFSYGDGDFEYIPKSTVIYRAGRFEIRGTYAIWYDSGKYLYQSHSDLSGPLNSGVGEIQLIDKDSFQLTFVTIEKDSKTIFTRILKRK